MLARDSQFSRRLGAETQEHEPVALAKFVKVDAAADVAVADKRDTQIEDALHFCVKHIARQTVVWYRVAQHTARPAALFVHCHGVAAARHLVGERQAGGAGADDANRLRAGFRPGVRQAQLSRQAPVAQEPFHGIDRHGAVLVAACAQAFAGVRTDTANCGGQRISFCEQPPRLVVGLVQAQPDLLVLSDKAQPPPHVAAVGALRLARWQLLQLPRQRLEWLCVHGGGFISAGHGVSRRRIHSPSRASHPARCPRRDSRQGSRCIPGSVCAGIHSCRTHFR